MKEIKGATISQVIERLTAILKVKGDLPVCCDVGDWGKVQIGFVEVRNGRYEKNDSWKEETGEYVEIW